MFKYSQDEMRFRLLCMDFLDIYGPIDTRVGAKIRIVGKDGQVAMLMIFEKCDVVDHP